MKNKKGQSAAMEFLMTYGWAILVVLVAIGALAYFGILSPSNMMPNQTIDENKSIEYQDVEIEDGSQAVTVEQVPLPKAPPQPITDYANETE